MALVVLVWGREEGKDTRKRGKNGDIYASPGDSIPYFFQLPILEFLAEAA